jgi:hypothetical protein
MTQERPVISATCHCGAIQIALPHAPETVTSCNCSICRRLGALWAFYPLNAVIVNADADRIDEYVWGKATRRFVRCSTCGCTTHVLPVNLQPDGKIEVNIRLFEPAEVGAFRVRHFDGAVTWKYVDEIPSSTEGDA